MPLTVGLTPVLIQNNKYKFKFGGESSPLRSVGAGKESWTESVNFDENTDAEEVCGLLLRPKDSAT
jgi:hypothetical protein